MEIIKSFLMFQFNVLCRIYEHFRSEFFKETFYFLGTFFAIFLIQLSNSDGALNVNFHQTIWLTCLFFYLGATVNIFFGLENVYHQDKKLVSPNNKG